MSKKTPLLDRVGAPVVVVVSVLVAVIAGALCWWQLVHYEDNLIEIFAEQQDQYVQLAVDQIEAAGSDDAGAVEGVLSSIVGSNSQYWTLFRNGDFVFVKDVADSNRYRGLPDNTYYDTDEAQRFVGGLTRDEVQHAVVTIDGRQFIASGEEFPHGGNAYRICLLTGKNAVIDHNAYLAARVNLATTIAVALALFVIFAIAMAIHNSRKSRRMRESDEEAAKLRSTIERLNDQIMGRVPVAAGAAAAVGASAAASVPAAPGADGEELASAGPDTHEPAGGAASGSATQTQKEATPFMGTQSRRIYRFKFYLNASHYVFFNGQQGEAHPHTWEFSLKILVRGDSVKKFSNYENNLRVIFDPYQNKTLNEVEPFDTIMPTLENIVEIFGEASRVASNEMGASLLEFEGSETPTRSYMVSYE